MHDNGNLTGVISHIAAALDVVVNCFLQVGPGPAQGVLQHSEEWKRPGLHRRNGQAHGSGMAVSQAAAQHYGRHPGGTNQGLYGAVHHVPPRQQAMHNPPRLEHAHVSQRGAVSWRAGAMQQPPQQYEGWDFQAQDSSRQEAQAWQTNERSCADVGPRQAQSAAEPFAQQHCQQPPSYMPHLGRGNALQDPLCGQPYRQPYNTPLYGATRGLGPDQMLAHRSSYAQRAPPTHEMPVLQESSHMYQDSGAYYDRPGRSQQQLGTPLQRQTYRGSGQGHEYDEQMRRSAMPAQPYMDAGYEIGEPMLQAPRHLHQMAAHDYPPRPTMPVRRTPQYTTLSNMV